MAKGESMELKEKWLDLNTLPYSNGISAELVREVVTWAPIKLTVELSLPSGKSARDLILMQSSIAKVSRALEEGCWRIAQRPCPFSQ